MPEAPHVVWGNAHDKMFERVIKEGCPLVDARGFEYIPDATLDEAPLSESLLCCGATLWVQNATNGTATGKTPSPYKPRNKGAVASEYYGGKMVDGIREGLGAGIDGVAKSTKATVKGTVKGTKIAAHGIKAGVEEGMLGAIKGVHAAEETVLGAIKGVHAVEKIVTPRALKEATHKILKLPSIPHDKELVCTPTAQALGDKHTAIETTIARPDNASADDSSASPSAYSDASIGNASAADPRHVGDQHTAVETTSALETKKSKPFFNPKKLGNKMNPKKMGRRIKARRLRRKKEDSASVDESCASFSADDDASIGSASVAKDPGHVADAVEEAVSHKKMKTPTGEGDAVAETELEEEQFTLVQPVPYELVWDEHVNIRIVSFPGVLFDLVPLMLHFVSFLLTFSLSPLPSSSLSLFLSLSCSLSLSLSQIRMM